MEIDHSQHSPGIGGDAVVSYQGIVDRDRLLFEVLPRHGHPPEDGFHVVEDTWHVD